MSVPLLSRMPARLVLCLALVCGCGKGDVPQPTGAARRENGPDWLPLAAVSADAQAASDAEGVPGPAEGSPEWLVREITRLRVQPAPETDDIDEIKAATRRRNATIIDLAQQTIARTHRDAEREMLFTTAVHHLMEARLQSALLGDREHIDAMYEDADMLARRDPRSKAAAEAAFTLVRFAEHNARRFGHQEPQWLREFSNQARLFATSFPQEAGRAAARLDAAAWSCEVHGLAEEALACYSLLKRQFPETMQGQQAEAVLRRLDLPGRPLQLAGPTLEGGFVNIDERQGRVVLVIFWATGTPRLDEQMRGWIDLAARHREAGLDVIGVNLDQDEQDLERFLEQHEAAWPNIFFVDRAKRRWDNPIVKYYGVRDIPMLWLVDRDGTVVDSMVDPADADALEQRVEGLLADE